MLVYASSTYKYKSRLSLLTFIAYASSLSIPSLSSTYYLITFLTLEYEPFPILSVTLNSFTYLSSYIKFIVEKLLIFKQTYPIDFNLDFISPVNIFFSIKLIILLSIPLMGIISVIFFLLLQIFNLFHY